MSDSGALSRSVLVVEDSAVLCYLYHAVLESAGFAVQIAANVPQALELLGGCRPDLVIADLGLPGGSGIDVIQAMQADPETRRIPVLCITSDDVNHTRGEILDRGCREVLVKPIRNAALLDAVWRHLEAHDGTGN
jgi:CheY-like chemotaxis protein